jgi:hypothetical protein
MGASVFSGRSLTMLAVISTMSAFLKKMIQKKGHAPLL